MSLFVEFEEILHWIKFELLTSVIKNGVLIII